MDNGLESVRRAIDASVPEALRIRRHIHQHPEISGKEENTSSLVAERLTAIGLDAVRTGVGGYGVVGTLRGTGGDGPVFALRADMDALPIEEESDLPYRSSVPGVMHACGHDGHTATLLGTADALCRLRSHIHGSVRFLFQPAEEVADGAKGMCDDGAMSGVDAIAALHGWPGMVVGKIGIRSGPMMASADTFDITLKGIGAHAAMPHLGVDPIVLASQITLALQTISSREISPTEPVVVTISQIHAGTAYNIIPGAAEMKGTVRCLRPELRKDIPERIERIVAGLCAASRASYKFHYRLGTPVTVNDSKINELISNIGLEVLGEDGVIQLESPSMGAEDFAVYLEYAPGAMFRLGVGEHTTPLHTPTYNFGDDPAPFGMEMLTRIALRYLKT